MGGERDNSQRWFRDSNRIGRFGRARRFGRAETGARRARARPERTGVPFARDRRVFLSLGTLVECRDRATSFGAASGAAGVSSGASRVSSRRARRGAAMDRARVASAAEASRARIEEDLGAGESVSERVGRVFAGYRCGTMTVRLDPTRAGVRFPKRALRFRPR